MSDGTRFSGRSQDTTHTIIPHMDVQLQQTNNDDDVVCISLYSLLINTQRSYLYEIMISSGDFNTNFAEEKPVIDFLKDKLH